MYADLEDGEGNTYMTWLLLRLCIDLKDYGWKTRTAFVRALDLKTLKKIQTDNTLIITSCGLHVKEAHFIIL